jgi:hypothetical protein
VWGEPLGRTRELVSSESELPVVGGDPETTYYLSGLAPVAAMARLKNHSTFLMEQQGGPARRADCETLLALGTSEQVRRAALARWDVAYVAFWLDREPQRAAYEEMRAQTGLFAPAAAGEHFALLAVKR